MRLRVVFLWQALQSESNQNKKDIKKKKYKYNVM